MHPALSIQISYSKIILIRLNKKLIRWTARILLLKMENSTIIVMMLVWSVKGVPSILDRISVLLKVVANISKLAKKEKL
jgi:hypothetical protein